MLSKEYTIRNATGLHARPAALIAHEIKKYDASLKFIKDGNCVQISSVIHILSMGLVQHDTITIETEGTDEIAAIAAIIDLLDSFDNH